jgi:hypothetical protein
VVGGVMTPPYIGVCVTARQATFLHYHYFTKGWGDFQWFIDILGGIWYGKIKQAQEVRL